MMRSYRVPGVAKCQVDLYRLWRCGNRTTAARLVKAAQEWGLDVQLKRSERGYSTRCVGGSNKLPDDVWIAFKGKRYGSGHTSNSSFAQLSLAEFAEDVLDSITDEQRRLVTVAYHLECLRDLEVNIRVEFDK